MFKQSYSLHSSLPHNPPFFDPRLFIGRPVIVKVFDYEIEGKLVYFKLGQKLGHLADLLVLECDRQHQIIRGWNVVKVK